MYLVNMEYWFIKQCTTYINIMIMWLYIVERKGLADRKSTFTCPHNIEIENHMDLEQL